MSDRTPQPTMPPRQFCCLWCSSPLPPPPCTCSECGEDVVDAALLSVRTLMERAHAHGLRLVLGVTGGAGDEPEVVWINTAHHPAGGSP